MRAAGREYPGHAPAVVRNAAAPARHRRTAAPELGDFYIELAYLSRQIHQRRKANNEKLDTGRCYPEKIDPLRQFQLLDWIEAELKRILGRDESEPVG